MLHQLEASGLWRRASACWLVVMGYSRDTDEEREWLLQRREYCLAQIWLSSLPERLDISEVARADDATLKRMGVGNAESELSDKTRYREPRVACLRINGKIRKRLARTVLIFTERSSQLSRATDRVLGLPASPSLFRILCKCLFSEVTV